MSPLTSTQFLDFDFILRKKTTDFYLVGKNWVSYLEGNIAIANDMNPLVLLGVGLFTVN